MSNTSHPKKKFKTLDWAAFLAKVEKEPVTRFKSKKAAPAHLHRLKRRKIPRVGNGRVTRRRAPKKLR